MSRCAGVATAIGDTAGTVNAQPTPGNAQQFTFSTFGQDGAANQRAFQFAIYC